MISLILITFDTGLSLVNADISSVRSSTCLSVSESELYVTGRVDAVGSITTNGWKMEIDERTSQNLSKWKIISRSLM